MSDLRAVAARRHHSDAEGAVARAAQHRAQRDKIIRELRAEDPRRWTYNALALTVGCSPELIAHIVRTGATADEAPMRNVCKGGFPRPHCPQWCSDADECRYAHPPD